MNKFLVLAVVLSAAVSCKRDVDPGFNVRGTNAGPNPAGLPELTLPLVITQDRQLSKDTCYLLNGKTYVSNNSQLIIQAGTRIEGIRKSTNDSASALVITRGSQIFAVGSTTQPVIFTSHEAVAAPGDWGGVVLLGSAPINKPDTSIEGINLPSVPAGVDIKYGGGSAGAGTVGDNSGQLSFVRIEYAGARIADNNELNGLTLGGVGNGTILDHIEVALGADDAFEFFGGTVNAKFLIAYSPNDDCFDTDFGWVGNIQFAVAVRRRAEVFADANGNESDNDGQSSTATPQTLGHFSNLTVLGLATAADVAAEGGLLNGARLRRNTQYQIYNSAYAGYNNGIAFEAGVPDSVNYSHVHGYVTASTLGTLNSTNRAIVGGDANNDLLLIDPFNPTAPNFRPASGSTLLTDGTNFANLSSWFQAVTFRGAFAATGSLSTWDKPWAVYNY